MRESKFKDEELNRKVKELKDKYSNTDSYKNIVELKNEIIKLDYTMSDLKSYDKAYNVLKDIALMFFPMFLSILSVFISLKVNEKYIGYFGACICIGMVIFIIVLIELTKHEKIEKIERNKYIMEKNIILIEIENRKENI